jgi:RHS repeat-associated protein
MASTNGASTLYLYNALGQMIEKSGTAGTTVYMQDKAGHAIGEYTSTGGLVEETVWLGDIPVATLQPNGSGGVNILYVHTDHLNTPRKVSRPSDNQFEWRWDTDPFGTTAANQNPAGLGTFVYDLRFAGQLYQAETGINQNWNRDYDPLVGKYVESDPIGLAGGGYSTYAYAGNNPTSYVDPTGQQEAVVGPVIIGAGVVAIGCYATGTCQQVAQALEDAYNSISNNPPVQNEAKPPYVTDPEANQEWQEYKDAYAQPPPPDLDQCELLKWQLKREQNLLAARQAWDAKWGAHHAEAIVQSQSAIKNLQEKLRKAGCKCP